MQAKNEFTSISAEELRVLLRSNSNVSVIDVREPSEHEESHIEGSLLIPLGSLANRINELNSHHQIVTYCKAGPRSQRAAALLVESGFTSVSYLRGGITAWR